MWQIIVQKPAARLLRVALLMLLFKLMFGDDEPRPEEVVLTYHTTFKVLLCLMLFFAADMVKVILAKIVAGHFHNHLHFTKMQDALNKVKCDSHPNGPDATVRNLMLLNAPSSEWMSLDNVCHCMLQGLVDQYPTATARQRSS